MENILITGGAGYLGGAITDILAHSDKNFYIYDRILYEESYRKNVNFIHGDIRNTEYLLQICEKYNITHVIWLAAIVGDEACNVNMLQTQEINTDSIKNFMKYFKGRICFTSSCSVYGAQDKFLTEDDKTNPLSFYASTKLAVENHLNGSNSIVFRLGTLYGISDNFARIRFDLVINKLVLNAVKDKKLIIFGGEQYRPFLHVRDAASNILKALFLKETGIYNLASSNMKISELAEKFIKPVFPGIEIEIHKMDFKDSRNYRVSIGKLSEIMKVSFNYTIDDGIEEIKKLLEEKRITNLNNSRYSNSLFLKSIDF